MSIGVTSQEFESYVPVYDAVPDKWEDARPFIVEQLKRLANAVNVREIGWFLDEELLSGKQFYPGQGDNPGTFRTILRKVVTSALTAGVNTIAHGITVDANFTLMTLYAAATNHGALTSEPIPNGSDTITMTATNFIVTVAANWDTCNIVCEYIQES
jgi:hypothetical protein